MIFFFFGENTLQIVIAQNKLYQFMNTDEINKSIVLFLNFNREKRDNMGSIS